MKETQPQAVYRAERDAARALCHMWAFALFGGLTWFVLWYMDSNGIKFPKTIPIWFFVVLYVSFDIVRWITEQYSTYRALLACQRKGILRYVRTKEILTRNPAAVRSGGFQFPIAAPTQNRLFYSRGFLILGLLELAFLIWFWCGMPGLPMRWRMAYAYPPFRLLITMTSLGVLAKPLFVRWSRRFVISDRGIRTPLRQFSWDDVQECHLERDYGDAGATEDHPKFKVTFFNPNRRQLGRIRLNIAMGAVEKADYIQCYEAILANMGYPPEPGRADPSWGPEVPENYVEFGAC